MDAMREVQPEEMAAVEGGWYALFAGAVMLGALYYYRADLAASYNWIWNQASSAWNSWYNNLTSDNSDYSYDTGDYYS